MPIGRLDALLWVEVRSSLWVKGGLTTPCVKGGPYSAEEEGPPTSLDTRVGLCERDCVSVLGNYNKQLYLDGHHLGIRGRTLAGKLYNLLIPVICIVPIFVDVEAID